MCCWVCGSFRKISSSSKRPADRPAVCPVPVAGYVWDGVTEYVFWGVFKTRAEPPPADYNLKLPQNRCNSRRCNPMQFLRKSHFECFSPLHSALHPPAHSPRLHTYLPCALHEPLYGQRPVDSVSKGPTCHRRHKPIYCSSTVSLRYCHTIFWRSLPPF